MLKLNLVKTKNKIPKTKNKKQKTKNKIPKKKVEFKNKIPRGNIYVSKIYSIVRYVTTQYIL
jgi:hypothetical protein